MSVQHDHLTMDTETADSHNEEAPKLEVASPNESLEAFGAALGGALLGMLATLLVLAIFNNGTLVFTNAESDSIAANVNRIDENLGAVNHNVEILAGRLDNLEGSLVDLDETLSSQGVQLEQVDETLAQLETTRQDFDLFTTALAQALQEMGAVESQEAGSSTAPAGGETQSPAPIVLSTDAVPANAVQALLFIDQNGNGALDRGETALVGASVTLTSEEGEEVTSSTTNSGVLFEDLAPGEYTVTVEDTMGYSLSTETAATATVEEDGEGQLIYFTVESAE